MEAVKKKKKKFTQPKLKKVPLVAEEAVLAVCKANTMSAGPGGSMGVCDTFLGMGSSAPCSTYGS